jgi:DNA-binding MarR family transcriptional regulator
VRRPLAELRDHQDLKAFLFEYVESYEELGVFVWFHRRSGASAPAARIAEESGLPEASVVDALDRLLARGLLSRSSEDVTAFRYTPAEDTVRDAVNRVMDLYQNNAVEVVGFMTANAIERVRTAGMRLFADCFRVGGPKSGG